MSSIKNKKVQSLINKLNNLNDKNVYDLRDEVLDGTDDKYTLYAPIYNDVAQTTMYGKAIANFNTHAEFIDWSKYMIEKYNKHHELQQAKCNVADFNKILYH